MNHIIDAIEVYRKGKGWTQEEMAKEMGVSRQTYGKYLSYNFVPSGKALATVAMKHSDIDLNHVMTGKGRVVDKVDITNKLQKVAESCLRDYEAIRNIMKELIPDA